MKLFVLFAFLAIIFVALAVAVPVPEKSGGKKGSGDTKKKDSSASGAVGEATKGVNSGKMKGGLLGGSLTPGLLK